MALNSPEEFLKVTSMFGLPVKNTNKSEQELFLKDKGVTVKVEAISFIFNLGKIEEK
jgi:hypothetical protein